MDLVAQPTDLKPYQPFTDISRAIAEVLGDYREESTPLVPVSTAVDPLAVPKGSCPKCLAARSETGSTCPCCGLAYERFHVSLVAPSDALVQGFVALQIQEVAVEEHLRLLSRAELLGELPQVVRLYRILLAREPDNELAKKVLGEAVRLASAPLAVAPAAPKSRTTRNLFMFLMVAVFLATVTIKTASALH